MKTVVVSASALALVACVATAARAGGCELVSCEDAEITLDGRYVILRPACVVDRVVDLQEGSVLRGRKARAAVADTPRIALPPRQGDSPFEAWLHRSKVGKQTARSRLAHVLPGGWILRYRAGSTDGCEYVFRGGLEIAPEATFKAHFEAGGAGPVPAPTHKPPIAPLGNPVVPDLRNAFTVGEARKVRGWKQYAVNGTYDAAAYRAAVPRVEDLARHGTLIPKVVRSESNTDGLVIHAAAPQGLWGALGLARGGHRIQTGLVALHTQLSAGGPVTFPVFKPYRWTQYTLTPR